MDKIILDDLSDKQIEDIKRQIKDVENKRKIKPKTITIGSDIHNKVKKYCAINNLKISEWVEEILLKNIK